MTTKKTREVLENAIQHYGVKFQIDKAIEELVELLNELCRCKTGRENVENITEEMADVTIVLWELGLIFANNERLSEEIEYKLDRLQSRIKRDRKRQC